MERIAVVMGKMHSGGKKNLVMEYYRHIDKTHIQFDFICDSDSNAIPEEEIKELGGRYMSLLHIKIFLRILSKSGIFAKKIDIKLFMDTMVQ